MPAIYRKRWLKNIGLSLCVTFASLAVSLTCLEIALRLFTIPTITPGYVITHPRRRYELRANFRGKTYDAKLAINSFGLRDEERPISKGDEAYRIAIYGDSIAFGPGVELEQTFPKILERQARASCKKPIQVFNFGVPSYSTSCEYIHLKDTYDTFRPHVVIIEFTAANDTSLFVPPGSLAGINRFMIVRWVKDLLRRSYSYEWLALRYYNLRYKLMFRRMSQESVGARLQYDAGMYADDYLGWIETKEMFRKIAEFCKARKVALVFAIFANSLSLSRNSKSDNWYPIILKVRQALKARGVEHSIVLDDAFRGYAGKEHKLWVRPGDAHFSPLAHQLAARALVSPLTKLLHCEKQEHSERLLTNSKSFD